MLLEGQTILHFIETMCVHSLGLPSIHQVSSVNKEVEIKKSTSGVVRLHTSVGRHVNINKFDGIQILTSNVSTYNCSHHDYLKIFLNRLVLP